jgi:hypothetical protein
VNKLGLFCLVVLLWLNGQAIAQDRGIINVNSIGDVLAWQKVGPTIEVFDSSYNRHLNLGEFTAEVNSLDLTKTDNQYYLLSTISYEVGIQTINSLNNPFPGTFRLTTEAIATARLLGQADNTFQVAFISTNATNTRQKIHFVTFTPQDIQNDAITTEIKTIFESPDSLTSLNLQMINDVIFVSWQERYGERILSYFSLSLDHGRTFRLPISFQFTDQLLALGIINNRLAALASIEKRSKWQQILIEPPTPPQIIGSLKQDNFAVNNPVTPLKLKVDLSTSNYFSSGTTISSDYLLYPTSTESLSLVFPSDLADGNYFVRLACFDGIQYSQYSQSYPLIINHSLSPEITVQTPSSDCWVKSGSSLIINAHVSDQQNDIPDETEANIFFDDRLLADHLYYYSDDQSLSGIIPLPDDLSDGRHQIKISLTDQANHKGEVNVNILTSDQPPAPKVDTANQLPSHNQQNFLLPTAGLEPTNLITNLVYGPNPFSPTANTVQAFSTNEKGLVFAYTLSQPADIKIRIYDLTGTLIWIKEINSASSGVTAWSGTDQFGNFTTNGIYPYFFSAAAAGQNETRRGKIIVVQ